MNLIHSFYEIAKKKTITELKKSKMYNLVLEGWSSNKNRRYINVGVHRHNNVDLYLIKISGNCTAVVRKIYWKKN
jgi:hypothetical protein